MTWLVNVHHEAAKQLEAIPPDRRKRILDDINELAEDPFRSLVKPLKGKEYKGRYRIIFRPIHATRTVDVLLVLFPAKRAVRPGGIKRGYQSPGVYPRSERIHTSCSFLVLVAHQIPDDSYQVFLMDTASKFGNHEQPMEVDDDLAVRESVVE
jgi:mRNA-degrading endonuclease RelE of RelBE toxin-antitoxin system